MDALQGTPWRLIALGRYVVPSQNRLSERRALKEPEKGRKKEAVAYPPCYDWEEASTRTTRLVLAILSTCGMI